MDEPELLRWRRQAWWMALAAIVGMVIVGIWLWIPHRDPLVWEWAERNRPLFWFAFFSAMLLGTSATYFLTVTASHRSRKKKKKDRSDIGHRQ